MKRLLTCVGFGIAMSFAATASAANGECDAIANIAGLDKKTKQEMVVLCEQKKLDAVAAGNSIMSEVVPDVEKMSERAMVSQEFAKAIGIAARELGYAANDFLDTTAGKLTAGLIIWHVAGNDIAGFVVGVPMLAVFWFVMMRLLARLRKGDTVYHDDGRRHWWGTRIVKEQKSLEYSEDRTWFLVILLVGLAVGTWAITGAIIF